MSEARIVELEKDLHRARTALLRIFKFNPMSLPQKSPGKFSGLGGYRAFEKQKLIAGKAYEAITDNEQHEKLDKEVSVSGEE